MIKPIIKDQLFLSIKSSDADINDTQIALDLLDTLKAHSSNCVGMAANMIGVSKNIIAINIGFSQILMINPRITSKSNLYTTKESCLSLIGERSTTRFKEIELDYLDINFKKHHEKYNGFIAQIIQHEIDHCNGIII